VSAGHHAHPQARLLLQEASRQRDPVRVEQVHIHEGCGEAPGGKGVARLLASAGDRDLPAAHGQDAPQEPADRGIVIDNQNPLLDDWHRIPRPTEDDRRVDAPMRASFKDYA